MSEVYRNGFVDNWDGKTGWATVQSEFGMTEPEPEEVIFADYEAARYEGSADVLYRNGDKFFYASGSHCSCMGLEDQWSPEEYTRETLLGQVERATYGMFKDQAELIRAAVELRK